MTTETLIQGIAALGPVHIAVVICVALVTIGTLWMFITFSELCCCLRRHQDGRTDVADEEQTYGTKATKENDGEANGRNTNEDCDTPNEGKESPEDRAAVNTIAETQVMTNTVQKPKSEKKIGFFSKKENKKAAASNPDKNEPVRNRINLFETSGPHNPLTTHRKDGTKPKKKKPTSKAFEEFERKGIIIGFGNMPHKRTQASEEREDDNSLKGHDPDTDDIEIPRVKVKLDTPLSGSQSADNNNSNGNSLNRLTDDEGIHTMDEEDDLNAVTRNSEVLKSFRRAPPPKNRSRARRPMQNRLAHRQDMTDFPGFEFHMEMDEAPEEGECSAMTTPSHSTDSIVTPSDRATPDNDTATSGHHTEEDSTRRLTPDSAAKSDIAPDSSHHAQPTARSSVSSSSYKGSTSVCRGSSSDFRDDTHGSKSSTARHKSSTSGLNNNNLQSTFGNVESQSGTTLSKNISSEYKRSKHQYDRSSSVNTPSGHKDSTPGSRSNATRRSVSDFRSGRGMTSESRTRILDTRASNALQYRNITSGSRGNNHESKNCVLDSRGSILESKHSSASKSAAVNKEKPVVLLVDSGPEQNINKENLRARKSSTKEVNEVSFTDFMSLLQRSNSKTVESPPADSSTSKSKVSFRVDRIMSDKSSDVDKPGYNTHVTAASQLDNPESSITAVTSPTFTSRVNFLMGTNNTNGTNPNKNNNNVVKTDVIVPRITDAHESLAHQTSASKLMLTRPHSFHPQHFPRTRDSPYSLSTSRNSNMPIRKQSASNTTQTPGLDRLGAERARSLSLGSPKFLRKWDSELSGLEARRKTLQEIEDRKEEKSVEKKVFKETAL